MRPTRDMMLMGMAEVVAGRSTCSRRHVGAIIARDGRSLSLGYNGAPAGLDHCSHRMNETDPCWWAVHAEANAIAWAARFGVTTDGAEIFTTDEPCLKCTQLIINAGICRVVYRHEYRVHDGLELLRQADIEVTQL